MARKQYHDSPEAEAVERGDLDKVSLKRFVTRFPGNPWEATATAGKGKEVAGSYKNPVIAEAVAKDLNEREAKGFTLRSLDVGKEKVTCYFSNWGICNGYGSKVPASHASHAMFDLPIGFNPIGKQLAEIEEKFGKAGDAAG